MKLSYVEKNLEKAVEMNPRRSIFLWGKPGIGKSTLVKAVAKHLGIGLIDLRLLYFDTVDMRGVPVPVIQDENGNVRSFNSSEVDELNGFVDAVKNGRTIWLLPSFFPRGGKGIIFLDELNQADPQVQKIGLQLALDYEIGDYKLPEGWIVVAAGNRESDKAHVQRMSAALNNRFIHVDVDVDIEDWLDWAVKNGVHPMVMAFLKMYPELLHQFDEKKNPRCFPTPRTWEMVSDLLKNGFIFGLEELIAGTVGEGVATQFLAFMNLYTEIPKIDEIFKNPSKAKVPTNPGVKYSLSVMLARKATVENIEKIKTYIERLGAEYSALTIKYLTDLHPTLKSTKTFVEWCLKYAPVLVNTTDTKYDAISKLS